MKPTDRWSEDDLTQAMQRMGKGGVVGTAKPSKGVRGRDECDRALNSCAGSNPAPSPKKEFDSKWEETYAAELVMRKHAGLIRNYWYHPTTFHLPGKVKYTPDFLIEYPSGMETRLEYIEIKGWSRNLRDGMTRLKIAAAIFDCYTWTLVKKSKGGGWSETVVEG